jgi:hypothetical protein
MSDAHTTIAVVERAPLATSESRMHPLVAMVMAAGTADPTTLREFLVLQREHEANEARKAYTHAMIALKRDLPTVINRDKVVDFTSQRGQTRYTHASLANVLDQVTPALTQHGFALGYQCSTGQAGVTVSCRLTHADGHSQEMSLTSPPDTSGSKSPAQAIASTITLLQRYSALALLGIATADMQEPEGKAAPAPAIDFELNMAAVNWITKQGLTVDQVAQHIGRRPDGWTDQDREEIKRWVRANARPAAPPKEEPPKQEPHLAKLAAACADLDFAAVLEWASASGVDISDARKADSLALGMGKDGGKRAAFLTSPFGGAK